MENFFAFLEQHANGIWMALVLLFAFILALNWLASIFRWGRYRETRLPNNRYDKLSYIITTFFANIINDFKHLLALVIVLIFTGLVIYSMAVGRNFQEKMDALQLVIASLGGLLGSIIGYYFGESAASLNAGLNANTSGSNTNIINADDEQMDEIIPVPDIEDTLNPDNQ